MARKKRTTVVKEKEHFRLEHLPLELLLEVLSFTTSSAGVYRSLLLVSKSLHSLVKIYCLQVVPIVLHGLEQLRSFNRLLKSSPKAPSFVRYLWVQGESLECWRLADSIVASCSSVVSLSCTSRTLKSLCDSASFSHQRCIDLTLIESRHDWKSVTATSHGKQFCAQITHLCLQAGLDPEFPKRNFTNLTHLAFACRPIGDYLQRYSENLTPIRSLALIVATTAFWRDGSPADSVTYLLENDSRLAILQFPNTWSELEGWKDRVRGGFSLWEQAKMSRQSMLVFRGALRALQA